MGRRPPDETELLFWFAVAQVAVISVAWAVARRAWERPWGEAKQVVEVGDGPYRTTDVEERRVVRTPLSVWFGAILSFSLTASIPLTVFPFMADMIADVQQRAAAWPAWFDAVYVAAVVAIPLTFASGVMLRAHVGVRFASALSLASGAAATATLVLIPHAATLSSPSFHLATLSWLALLLVAWTVCLAGAARAEARRRIVAEGNAV